MADGLFDSGGGGGGSSYDYSTNNYGGSSSSNLDPTSTLVLLAIFALIFGVYWLYTSVELAKERELDATVYVETSRANFDAWTEAQGYDLNTDSLWFEDGSSHRKTGNGGDYHCKGGQFRDTAGDTVTFCCAVELDRKPLCVAISP